MNVMLAYTEFDRPFAAPPGVPQERLQILRDSFERMLKDGEFAADAKKLLDWDGATFLSGERPAKKDDRYGHPAARGHQAGEGDIGRVLAGSELLR